MHIIDCLSPKRIVNPYTHKVQLVPCGKCASCMNARGQRWVQRLDQERYCWQYALFFTLTYNNDNLPVLHKTRDGFAYVDTSGEHYDIKGRGDFPFINIRDFVNSFAYDSVKYSTQQAFVNRTDSIPYVSVYDLQKFVKLIRIHIKRKLNTNEKIRYFICTEYGPKHRRPHAHGIFFFNSSELAAALPLFIREDWKHGFVDTSFVSGTNSKYVASYCNCITHLPEIYKNKYLRPFILCSRQPPIGTLAHRTEEIQKVFFEASPEFVIQNHSTGLFDNVPLWQYYKNSLFPKLTNFSDLSHNDRITLYSAVSRIEERCCEELTFSIFRNAVESETAIPTYKRYLQYFRSFNSDITNSLLHWYQVSSRVLYQSASFGITIRQYVSIIEKFYDNFELYKLKNQYTFQEEYSEKYGSASLIGMDSLYLQSMIDLDLGSLDYGEILTLQSFGIDIGKFYSDDLTERYEYQLSLFPESQLEYQVFRMDSEIIRSKNTKTKIKNEYIQDCKDNDILHSAFADF